MCLIRAKIKANICQKDIVKCRRLQNLNFAGLMMRFSSFLNQLINTNINVNMYLESVRSKYERVQEMLIESHPTLYLLFVCKSKIFVISFFVAIVSYRKDKYPLICPLFRVLSTTCLVSES